MADVFNEDTVAQSDGTLGASRERGIVCDEHDGAASFAIEHLQEFDNALSRGAIEISGGLVGEENARLIDEGAGERHALLFAAGKLLGKVVDPVSQPHPFEQIAGPLAGFANAHAACQFQGDLHIFERGECRDQLKALEDESNFLPT